jgi:sugar phosphate isomerase/epimerase
LHHIFQVVKTSGYDGIDISIDFSNYDTINATYLTSLVRDTGVPIVSVTAPERKLTKKQFDQILSLANGLGTKIVNIHPPHRLDREKDWFGDYLKVMVQKYPSITINIINAPPKTWLFVISEYGDARPETIKKITEHTALSIANVDPSSGVDLMKTSLLLGSTLGYIYFSDKSDDAVGVFPGDGTMPLESLLIKLHEVGYDGYFSLSVNPSALGIDEGEEEVIKKLAAAKVFLSRYFPR